MHRSSESAAPGDHGARILTFRSKEPAQVASPDSPVEYRSVTQMQMVIGDDEVLSDALVLGTTLAVVDPGAQEPELNHKLVRVGLERINNQLTRLDRTHLRRRVLAGTSALGTIGTTAAVLEANDTAHRIIYGFMAAALLLETIFSGIESKATSVAKRSERPKLLIHKKILEEIRDSLPPPTPNEPENDDIDIDIDPTDAS